MCVHRVSLHVDKKCFTRVWCWDAYANAYLLSDIAVQNAVEMVVLLLRVVLASAIWAIVCLHHPAQETVLAVDIF